MQRSERHKISVVRIRPPHLFSNPRSSTSRKLDTVIIPLAFLFRRRASYSLRNLIPRTRSSIQIPHSACPSALLLSASNQPLFQCAAEFSSRTVNLPLQAPPFGEALFLLSPAPQSTLWLPGPISPSIIMKSPCFNMPACPLVLQMAVSRGIRAKSILASQNSSCIRFEVFDERPNQRLVCPSLLAAH